jgi:GTPase involved in cell partitioning and DNA repair
LILKINNKKYKNDIEFLLIDRKSKEKKEELNLIEEEEEFNEIIEKDKQSDYSILMNEWFSYQDNINFKNYDIVLNKYKLFFKDNKRKMKVKEINSTKIQEYNKYIQFNENLISLYEKIDNSNNERINKMISNIIYICSELVDYGDFQNGKDNEYLMKIRKYIISKNKK